MGSQPGIEFCTRTRGGEGQGGRAGAPARARASTRTGPVRRRTGRGRSGRRGGERTQVPLIRISPGMKCGCATYSGCAAIMFEGRMRISMTVRKLLFCFFGIHPKMACVRRVYQGSLDCKNSAWQQSGGIPAITVHGG